MPPAHPGEYSANRTRMFPKTQARQIAVPTSPGRACGAIPDQSVVPNGMSLSSTPLLLPPIRVLRKPRPLYPYDTESLTGRCLHHDPAFQAIDDLRTHLLQSRDFGRDIVCLDVDVHAAFVFDALEL